MLMLTAEDAQPRALAVAQDPRHPQQHPRAAAVLLPPQVDDTRQGGKRGGLVAGGEGAIELRLRAAQRLAHRAAPGQIVTEGRVDRVDLLGRQCQLLLHGGVAPPLAPLCPGTGGEQRGDDDGDDESRQPGGRHDPIVAARHYPEKVTASGSSDDFGEVVARLAPRLFRIAVRMCGRADEAEDLVQDTLLQAFRKWDQFEGRADPATWLYTIAGRLCQRRHRRRAGEPARME